MYIEHLNISGSWASGYPWTRESKMIKTWTFATLRPPRGATYMFGRGDSNYELLQKWFMCGYQNYIQFRYPNLNCSCNNSWLPLLCPNMCVDPPPGGLKMFKNESLIVKSGPLQPSVKHSATLFMHFHSSRTILSCTRGVKMCDEDNKHTPVVLNNQLTCCSVLTQV